VLADYLPILVLLVLAIAFGTLSLAASSFLRPNRPNPVKLSPYECGIEPIRLPQGERFSVTFHLIAMLFIIFDVETIFLFVWAVSLRRLGLFGLAIMAIFIVLLFVVEAYVWMKGGFEWERPARRRHRTAAESAAASIEPQSEVARAR
jgi:NADH-quinone oxidoreductase subunit A